MSQLILLFLLVLISCLFFFVENKSFGSGFSMAGGTDMDMSNQKVFSDLNKQVQDETLPSRNNEFVNNKHLNNVSNTIIPSNKAIHCNSLKITNANKDLKNNLKLLEYIMTIESHLANQALKNCYSTDKLEEYLIVKKEIQYKILELSKFISQSQSNQNYLS
ncbi:hypothetical protein ACFO5O_13030 [Geojedonia litorea]|uniref:Uncharacterized protein n=1 Tax=Geojedonia litorea TaxID=1268269 RepID=A0ABV9N8I1_9FLAO